MKLSDNPNKTQFDEIISWFYREWEEKESDFYSNRELIKNSFEEGSLLVFENEGNSLGFLTWLEHKENKVKYCTS